MMWLICLIISAILGGIIGWLLRGMGCKSRIAELEASLASRDSEMAGLRSSLSKAKGDASAENAKDDAEITDLKKKIASLESDLAAKGKLEADLNASRDKVVSLEADLKAAGEKHASLESDFKAKAAALAAVPAAAAVSGVSQDEHDKLKAEYAALRTQYDEAEGEKSFLLERLKKAEAGEVVKRKPPESEWDDLELINGIGPVLERMLYDMGIYTFKEIAQWDAAKIAEIDAALPRFKGRIEREGWVESAKEEHFKKYGEKL